MSKKIEYIKKLKEKRNDLHLKLLTTGDKLSSIEKELEPFLKEEEEQRWRDKDILGMIHEVKYTKKQEEAITGMMDAIKKVVKLTGKWDFEFRVHMNELNELLVRVDGQYLG